ncbi:OmpA family protein [Nannocystis bainbridge]|uniref:OmpA family protein n=1 Tax=Nannocystis bainbridge TaxID=2995303 RepID=A0ABT5E6B1_9BACT|nr:OmpA family protein [Nannocystis bainbridge]MDC0720950.1 OmpA family protein [Nannocystis bainbridge]
MKTSRCFTLIAALGLAGSLATEASAAEPRKAKEESRMRRFRPERNTGEIGIFLGTAVFAKYHDFYDPATAPQERIRRPSFEGGVRAAYFPLSFLGLELEFGALPVRYDPGGDAFMYAFRGHGILQLPFFRIVPFILGGYGLMGIRSPQSVAGKDIDPVGHYGVGVKFHVTRMFTLRLDARHLVAAQAAQQTDGTSHLEVLAGASLTLGRKKQQPAKVDTDRDRDGVVNDKDRCPDEAGDMPDGCPDRDSDGDSFFDSKDRCPDVPGVAPDGCPPADRDRDSFLDDDDKCPEEPGVAPDGCPIRDSDGDRILDPDDKCPNEPENRNGYEDTDGCPDEMPAAITKFTGVIKGIFFDLGKATIKPTSKKTMDGTVQVLKDFPSIRVEIVGHTDNTGSRDVNLDLSRQRAESVREYLVAQGIAADRIQTRGAGPDEPIADNKTAKGRAVNRRIEYKVITE